MKKTTYILIGLVIAGAVAVALSVVYIHRRMFLPIEMKTIIIGDDTATTQLEPFSRIYITGNREFAPHQTVTQFDQDPGFILNIVGSDDITEPEVTMNPEWEKYLTLTVSDSLLTVNFDFHGIEPYEVGDSDDEDEWWSLMVGFSPQPVTITVPSAVLTDIQPLNWVDTNVSGLTSASLKCCWNSAIVFYNNCNIETLTITSTELVKQDSACNDDNVEGDYYGYDPDLDYSWFGSCQSTVNNCSISTLALNLPATSVKVCGDNTTIGLIEWIETPSAVTTDNQEIKTAMLDVKMTGVDNVKWIPMGKNRFELTSSGPMTTTFGKVD